ncbi:hypothetical protein FQN54_002352 [Arachnomyces sp. PD_36]|nr:hypothetical protein FQN54_002352 [Arachnomyces sp. PD_36]
MPLVRQKALIPIAALVTIALFFWCIDRYDRASLLNFRHPVDKVPAEKNQAQVQLHPQKLPQTCDFDPASAPPLPFTEWLVRKNYTRAYIRPRHVDSHTEFKSMEEIPVQVLPEFRALERGIRISKENQDPTLPCPPVVDVDVAAELEPDNTEQMLFGAATTAERLDRLLPSLLYSFGSTKASLLILVPESDDDLELQQTYFRNRGLDITLKSSPLEFTARYFGLVEAFTEHIKNERPNTTWVGWIDDDTFFLDLAAVAEQLSQFDATEKHYIGSLSEASWQVDHFGHIAFGGAGVFVSKPLLAKLKVAYDECQAFGEQPGDQKLAQCIQRFGDTPLTLWPSLYQMDMKGAPDGVYESGRKIDTLHHWGSWYTKDVVKMSTVSAAAGRRSVLRRWIFDQSINVDNTTGTSTKSFHVLTNGYSIVKYTLDKNTPDDAINFDYTEHTWDEDPRGYEQRLGPLRPVVQEGVEKERWMMAESLVVGDNVHQFYTREADDTHSVIELVWLGPQGGGGAGVGGTHVVG